MSSGKNRIVVIILAVTGLLIVLAMPISNYFLVRKPIQIVGGGPQFEPVSKIMQASCADCHSPGHFTGHPDSKRQLDGSDVRLMVPGTGVFGGPNLKPDPTGLGFWSRADIFKAFSTDERPDRRVLTPIML